MKRMLAVSLAVVLSLSLAAYRKNAALSESTAERKTIPQSTTAPLPLTLTIQKASGTALLRMLKHCPHAQKTKSRPTSMTGGQTEKRRNI